jgi:hypothetical protein
MALKESPTGAAQQPDRVEIDAPDPSDPSDARPEQPPGQPPEQLRYARWLEWGARIGIVVLVLSFGLYLLGALPSKVPPHQLSTVWGLPLAQYLQATQAPTGWAWLGRLGYADTLPLLGIALLAGASVPALLAQIPTAWRRGDPVFAGLCLAAAGVIVLAASGWLTGGH